MSFKFQKIEYYQGDVTKTDFGDGAFDVIVAFEIIEHVVNDAALIALWVRMLKENGMLIFSSPDQQIFPWSAEDHPFHIRHYSIGDIKRMIKETHVLQLEEHYSQDKKREMYEGQRGRFNIFVVRKKIASQ